MKILLFVFGLLVWMIPPSLCIAVYTSLNNKAWAVFFIILILSVCCCLAIKTVEAMGKKGGSK